MDSTLPVDLTTSTSTGAGPSHHYVPGIASLIPVIEEGTLSRTVFSDDRVKVIIFSFDTGQELSEHTASMPAIIQIISGSARLTMGSESYTAEAGAWAYMQPNLPHSVHANEPLTMLLTLIKKQHDPAKP